MIIRNFDDFCAILIESGFSMAGGNDEGIFSIIPWSWKETAPYETEVQWHTGNIETDPWEWRMYVLDERNDIAYAKLFFNKSGYITAGWYPYFFAVRRGNTTMEEAYEDGKISHMAKQLYDIIRDGGSVPLHMLKDMAGIGPESKNEFTRALIELQMKMYITMCGRAQKLNRKGEEYGWDSTVFCTVENFWGKEFMAAVEGISKEQAVLKITEQIYRLNPNADEKRIRKFIGL